MPEPDALTPQPMPAAPNARHSLLLAFLAALLTACGTLPGTTQPLPHCTEAMKDFLVIAHRGASGYLPEHTLEAVAMAHAMGADYIEQDVLMTRDDRLIVLHDLYLDAVTDVAERFPARQREDGRHYAIDFTLDEIRTLRVHERVGEDGQPAFPGRFPANEQIFRVPTLDEEIRLIQGLNGSTGSRTGLYIEPKSPAWHAAEGEDLMATLLNSLQAHGLAGPEQGVLLQSFDADALRRARRELHSELRMVQLIGENSWNESPTDFDFLRTREGLESIAEYAQGIGPWLPQVVDLANISTFDVSDLVVNIALKHG